MEIKVKEETIKLKKDFLTNGEVNYIVSEVLKLYNETGDIKDYNFNPLTMIGNFYSLLFEACIEDYDNSSIDDFNHYYSLGVQYKLLKVITNAREAYDLMIKISNQMSKLDNTISVFLNRVLTILNDKMLSKDELETAFKDLPKELENALSDLKEVFKNKKEDE